MRIRKYIHSQLFTVMLDLCLIGALPAADMIYSLLTFCTALQMFTVILQQGHCASNDKDEWTGA